MTPGRFKHFVAIDWSGARGLQQKGIAMAVCAAEGGPPVLVKRNNAWNRDDVLAVLRDELLTDSLVGMDLGIALPFADCSAYFPGWEQSPADARKLWVLIDQICTSDPNLEVQSFITHPVLSSYFRHGKATGARFRCDGAEHGRGRFRVTEHAQAAMGCKPYSNFNLVGAAQVGKSSLTGMRMLNRLQHEIAVWPIDPLPETGSVIVEIYTSLAALEAGRSASKSKLRSYEELNNALVVLGSPPVDGNGPIDDHSSDALLTAAWLRKVADDPARWKPDGLTPKIAATEGWTFGAF